MKKKVIVIFVAVLLFLSVAVGLVIWLRSEAPAETSERGEGPSEEVSTSGLIQPSDLVYKGAFALPEGDSVAESWMYAGSAMTYYPAGDPDGPDDGYPGSIFGTGHEQYQYISEISIPEPVVSETKNAEELNQAETLQSFTDIKGDRFGELELPRVGLEYLDERLHFCWAPHLHETENAASHGSCSTDLSDPDVYGPYQIQNEINYVTADYIFKIPEEWAEENTAGIQLATGRFRDGGQGSQGPTIIAYDPNSEPPYQNKVLLKYSSVVEDPNAKNALNGYHHSDAWNGAVWVESQEKEAVVFVGVKGHGDCWYGYSDGTVWPQEAPFPEPGAGERGWWSDSFTGQFIFYNPSDLAKVSAGEVEPYEPQPYAELDITDYLYNTPEDELWMMIGAMSYDSENGILYLFEYNGDAENNRSIIHVWEIQTS